MEEALKAYTFNTAFCFIENIKDILEACKLADLVVND
jgi:predicted amidohydrolase YtcJ